MSQILLFTPPNFRGILTATPSGTAYKVAPGETLVAEAEDEAFLLSYGFTAAPSAISSLIVTDGSTTVASTTELSFTEATVAAGAAGVAEIDVSAGASLTIQDQGGDSVASVGTITFQGPSVYGTTPSGIVNMTTITGAEGTDSTPGVGITLQAGADSGSGEGAGNISITAGYGSTAASGGSVSLWGGSDGGSGPGPLQLHGGQSETDGQQGGDVIIVAGDASVGDAEGGDFLIGLGQGSGSGRGGELLVNDDPSLIAVSHSWSAGQNPNGMTIHTSTRAEVVTAVIVRPDAANGTASTLVVVKAASGTAPSGGTALTSDSADLTGTAATNQTLTLSTTLADITLAAGDSLCLVTTGTLTLSAGCVTVWATPQ